MKQFIYKCEASNNAFVGLLHDDGIFEYLHANVGAELDADKIIDICRKGCVGTRIGGEQGLVLFNKMQHLRSQNTRKIKERL